MKGKRCSKKRQRQGASAWRSRQTLGTAPEPSMFRSSKILRSSRSTGQIPSGASVWLQPSPPPSGCSQLDLDLLQSRKNPESRRPATEACGKAWRTAPTCNAAASAPAEHPDTTTSVAFLKAPPSKCCKIASKFARPLASAKDAPSQYRKNTTFQL